MSYKVGCVPYVNAVPLVLGFEEQGLASPVQIVYDVPSRLPQLLEDGEIDAMLVSSFDPLTNPSRRVAPGVGISSFGPVDSVRLFSRVDLDKIESLCLDQSSMTSNALAQIILSETYGVLPKTTKAQPDLESMLEENDACVLIGDIGMETNGEDYTVLDLGEAWLELTGLPFVWAVWAGSDRLTPELSSLLRNCSTIKVGENDAILDRCVRAAQMRVNWSPERIKHYLRETIHFELASEGDGALKLFQEKIFLHGLADRRQPLTVS
ncbi:MAG: menaquinone biosynthetic enzyme MqnA/MqnD family protein [Fimbriimonas sp.]